MGERIEFRGGSRAAVLYRSPGRPEEKVTCESRLEDGTSVRSSCAKLTTNPQVMVA